MPSVTTISMFAFNECTALTTVTMPSVRTITMYSFYGCTELTTVTMPSAMEVGIGAFFGCTKLTTVTMPSVTTLSEYSFNGCIALTTVTMPSVRTIDEYSFGGCTALTSLSLSSVTTVHLGAFYGCTSLETIRMYTIPSDIRDYAFLIGVGGHQVACTVYVNSTESGQLDGYTDENTQFTYTEMVYDVTYRDMGGTEFSGTLGAGSPTTHTYGTATTLVDATKIGYTFGGWFTASDCSGEAITSIGGTAITSDAQACLYAKWNIITYDVTYELNNGINAAGNPSSYDVTTPEFTLLDATRSGYIFVGWFDGQSSGDEIETIAGGDIGVVALYARWKLPAPGAPTVSSVGDRSVTLVSVPGCEYRMSGGAWSATTTFAVVNGTATTFHQRYAATADTIVSDESSFVVTVYTVSYNLNNGTGDSPATQYECVYLGATVSAFTGITRAGYSASTWNTMANGSGMDYVPGATYVGESNIILYAKWSIVTYDVTYELNNGTNAAGNLSTYDVTTPEFTLLDATRSGYIFVGWFDDQSSGDEIETIAGGDIGNMTIYARWFANEVTVTELKGGLSYTGGATVTLSGTSIVGDKSSNVTTFTGVPNGTYPILIGGVAIGASVVVDNGPAAATVNYYTVTFKWGDTPETSSDIPEVYGANYVLPTTPVRDGYAFCGWSTSSAVGGFYITAASIVDYAGDQFLYAHWTAVVDDTASGEIIVESDEPTSPIAIVKLPDAVDIDDKSVVVGNEAWAVTLPSSTAAGIFENGDAKTNVEMFVGELFDTDLPDDLPAEAVGKPILQLSISVDGTPYESDFSEPVTVTVRYDSRMDYTLNIKVWCLDAGSLVAYDAIYTEVGGLGYLTFTVPHFSYWVIEQQEAEPESPILFIGIFALIAIAAFMIIRRR